LWAVLGGRFGLVARPQVDELVLVDVVGPFVVGGGVKAVINYFAVQVGLVSVFCFLLLQLLYQGWLQL
jgi:hypothetical protein